MEVQPRRDLRGAPRSLAASQMTAIERVFLDSNVLVYGDDAAAGAKRDRAVELIGDLVRTGAAVISTQVLQEYYSVATRKLRLAPVVARARVETFARIPVVLIRPD